MGSHQAKPCPRGVAQDKWLTAVAMVLLWVETDDGGISEACLDILRGVSAQFVCSCDSLRWTGVSGIRVRADACILGSVVPTLWLGEPGPVSAAQSRDFCWTDRQTDRQLKSPRVALQCTISGSRVLL